MCGIGNPFPDVAGQVISAIWRPVDREALHRAHLTLALDGSRRIVVPLVAPRILESRRALRGELPLSFSRKPHCRSDFRGEPVTVGYCVVPGDMCDGVI